MFVSSSLGDDSGGGVKDAPAKTLAAAVERIRSENAPGRIYACAEEFTEAVEAFRGGRPGAALKLFQALEARGDGWLLPPEARLDRARCLAAQGRREEARAILLAIGDSRFQSDVDRILEGIGSARKGP